MSRRKRVKRFGSLIHEMLAEEILGDAAEGKLLAKRALREGKCSIAARNWVKAKKAIKRVDAIIEQETFSPRMRAIGQSSQNIRKDHEAMRRDILACKKK